MIGRSLAAALLAVLCLTACRRGPATPREALAALRDATLAGDGARIFALQDAESRGRYRQRVRTLRARLARGDPPEDVMVGLDRLPYDAAGLLAAEEEAVIAEIMKHYSPAAHEAEWRNAATVIDEVTEGERAARLTLRGTDDETVDLWFVRERGVWLLDQYRTERALER